MRWRFCALAALAALTLFALDVDGKKKKKRKTEFQEFQDTGPKSSHAPKKPVKKKMTSDSMRCGVCRAIMDEVAYGIAQVDPKKTIQTGNFRISPDGSLTEQKHAPYARSEVHLSEIMENMCSKFKDYADVGGDVQRINKRPGEKGPLTLKGGLSIGQDTKDQFRHKCTDIVGDIDEDIVSHFNKVDGTKATAIDRLCPRYCQEGKAKKKKKKKKASGTKKKKEKKDKAAKKGKRKGKGKTVHDADGVKLKPRSASLDADSVRDEL